MDIYKREAHICGQCPFNECVYDIKQGCKCPILDRGNTQISQALGVVNEIMPCRYADVANRLREMGRKNLILYTMSLCHFFRHDDAGRIVEIIEYQEGGDAQN